MRYRDSHPLPDPTPTGTLNKITDIPGLRLGHHTVIADSPTILRTGVSVLEIESVIKRPVAASSHVFNGYGKTMGLPQIDELGSMESHLYLTNTLGIGAVQQGAVQYLLRHDPQRRSFNAVVTECNDSHLSDIGALAVTPEMVFRAHEDAREDFALGSVGAGTGMVCFGFKGGIGSASRALDIDGTRYHVGALVLANFGRQSDLHLPGFPQPLVGPPNDERGSLIIVIATDLPLLPHQLQRVARHSTMAIGMLGSPGHHGSGDFAIAFSTTCRLGGSGIVQLPILADDGEILSLVFRAAAWSAAEAIIDAMWCSPTMKGFRGEVPALKDFVTKQRPQSGS